MLSHGIYSYSDLVASRRSNELFVSKFWYNDYLGSRESIDTLTALAYNDNSGVWTAPLTQAYLDRKWKRLLPILMVQATLYYCFLLLISVYSTSYVESFWLSITTLVMSIVYVGLELS